VCSRKLDPVPISPTTKLVLTGPESSPALHGEGPGSNYISRVKVFLGKDKPSAFKFPVTPLCFTIRLFATVVDKAMSSRFLQ
jgi:hypothetical protein